MNLSGDENDWGLGFEDLVLGMEGERDMNFITEDLEVFNEPHRHAFVWKDDEYLKVYVGLSPFTLCFYQNTFNLNKIDSHWLK